MLVNFKKSDESLPLLQHKYLEIVLFVNLKKSKGFVVRCQVIINMIMIKQIMSIKCIVSKFPLVNKYNDVV